MSHSGPATTSSEVHERLLAIAILQAAQTAGMMRCASRRQDEQISLAARVEIDRSGIDRSASILINLR